MIKRSSPFYSHFRCDRVANLTEFLQKHVGLSPLRIKTLFEFRSLYLNGKRIHEDVELKAEDVVRVHFQPKRFLVPGRIETLYEDQDFLAIDKPYGLPTHPTVDNYLENAWYLMQKQAERRLYVTHRLDTGTEGVLILAKSPEAQAEFNHYLQKRLIHKLYRAITEQPVPLGRHEHHIQTEGPIPKPTFAEPVADSSVAILHVTKTWELEEGYGCEVELETGRTHQIRAQFSFLGCPILGDVTYGGQKKYVHERLALECFRITFAHRSRTIGIYRPTSLAAPHSTKDSRGPF